MGVSLGIVEKSGAWYSFGEDRIGQGRQNVKRFLAENRDIRDKIADLILEQTGLKKAQEEALEEKDEAKKS